MNFTIPKETQKEILKLGVASKALKEPTYKSLDVDANTVDAKDLEKILKVAEAEPFCLEIANRRLSKAVHAWKAIQDNAKSAKIKTLEQLETALKKVVEDKKILFIYNKTFEAFLPYFVSEIEFSEAQRGLVPTVSVSLKGRVRGHTNSDSESLSSSGFSFNKASLKGCKKNVLELLEEEGAHLWSQKLWDSHLEDLKIWEEIRHRSGGLYNAKGNGMLKGESYWSHEISPMEYHGQTAKVVIDDPENYGKDGSSITCEFWDDEEEEVFEVPDLPILLVFHLQHHDFYHVHVRALSPYPFDQEALKKIVLPSFEHKEILDNLTSEGHGKADVIRGKAGGIIILCTGKPGTGKTLSSEVYAEATKKALYTVQCSQLGTDPDELEKNLSTVLDRAVRWNAILLIDEADVYIHERGSNLKQNAIVGVFLRLLEYYDGILFMNTNREVLIDDAIMSRVTAHLTYEHAHGGPAIAIWYMLLEHYGVNVEAQACFDRFGIMSGRRIRNIVRLAALSAEKKGEKTSMNHLTFAERFQAKEYDSK